MVEFARAIVLHDDKLLLIKRDKFGKKFFAFPGGKIEDGESAEEAARREVMEESSIDITITRPVFKHKTVEFGEQVYFLSEYIDGEPKIQEGAIEDILNKRGENIFEPVWIGLDALESEEVLPRSARDRVLECAKSSFPEQVETLAEK